LNQCDQGRPSYSEENAGQEGCVTFVGQSIFIAYLKIRLECSVCMPHVGITNQLARRGDVVDFVVSENLCSQPERLGDGKSLRNPKQFWRSSMRRGI
jgi:hypothetical protein